jgi:hypothetical protein
MVVYSGLNRRRVIRHAVANSAVVSYVLNSRVCELLKGIARRARRVPSFSLFLGGWCDLFCQHRRRFSEGGNGYKHAGTCQQVSSSGIHGKASTGLGIAGLGPSQPIEY